MDEVETGRQVLGGDVVGQDLERGVARRCGLKEVRLKIRGDDESARSDTLGQPEGHRSAAGADFQTACPRTYPKSGEVVTRPRVESRLEPGEPHTLHFPGMVVLVALRHGQRLLSPRPPNEAAEDAAEGSRSAGASPGNGCGLSGARATHHGRPEGDLRFLSISA